MSTKYGFTLTQWDAIKSETHDILIEVARQQNTITYSDLAQQLTTATLHAGSYALGALLREVCHDEETAERGLICALVVRKSTGQPGNGFFKYARQFGRDISDPAIFWQSEITYLYEIWNDE